MDKYRETRLLLQSETQTSELTTFTPSPPAPKEDLLRVCTIESKSFKWHQLGAENCTQDFRTSVSVCDTLLITGHVFPLLQSYAVP